MAPEAQLEQTAEGLVAKTDGWFVLNAREARWYHAEGRSAFCDFEGELDFTQLGINISVLGPGESMAMYHWEADQEDFLVVAGEAVLIVEGEERPLQQWDFVHCPPNAKHTIVGAGRALRRRRRRRARARRQARLGRLSGRRGRRAPRRLRSPRRRSDRGTRISPGGGRQATTWLG